VSYWSPPPPRVARPPLATDRESSGGLAAFHELPLGELHYEFSRHLKPAVRVESGDTVVVETEDAFSGQIRKEGDRRDRTTVPYGNPVSGPIAVAGAEPGDAVVIEVLAIEPLIGQCATYAVMLPFVNFHLGPSLEDQTRVCPIEDGRIIWSERLSIPYAPMIGCIGTAPAMGSPTCFPAGDHGGNVDLRDITIGATVYLPVAVPGALVFVGDCHAAQGEGEFGLAALEMPGRVTLRVDLAKQRHLPGLRLESAGEIGAVGVGRTMEEGIAAAYSRLALWLEEDYDWNRWEAYSLLTQVGQLSLGFTFNGIAAARVRKEYVA
jgi:amidase